MKTFGSEMKFDWNMFFRVWWTIIAWSHTRQSSLQVCNIYLVYLLWGIEYWIELNLFHSTVILRNTEMWSWAWQTEFPTSFVYALRTTSFLRQECINCSDRRYEHECIVYKDLLGTARTRMCDHNPAQIPIKCSWIMTAWKSANASCLYCA